MKYKCCTDNEFCVICTRPNSKGQKIVPLKKTLNELERKGVVAHIIVTLMIFQLKFNQKYIIIYHFKI